MRTRALEYREDGKLLRGFLVWDDSQSEQRPGILVFHEKVLVCHGALDPFVTLEHVTTFTQEMQAAGVDFQVIVYGGAKHGFTNRAADRFGHQGIAYHESSDARSWAAMRQFLAEVFGAWL